MFQAATFAGFVLLLAKGLSSTVVSATVVPQVAVYLVPLVNIRHETFPETFSLDFLLNKDFGSNKLLITATTP